MAYLYFLQYLLSHLSDTVKTYSIPMTGYICHMVQSVLHGPVISTSSLGAYSYVFSPGEIHLGYFMTAYVDLLPCLCWSGIVWQSLFPNWRTLVSVIDGHCLLHLICSICINLCQLDAH